jgi:hypothetical protein
MIHGITARRRLVKRPLIDQQPAQLCCGSARRKTSIAILHCTHSHSNFYERVLPNVRSPLLHSVWSNVFISRAHRTWLTRVSPIWRCPGHSSRRLCRKPTLMVLAHRRSRAPAALTRILPLLSDLSLNWRDRFKLAESSVLCRYPIHSFFQQHTGTVLIRPRPRKCTLSLHMER